MDKHEIKELIRDMNIEELKYLQEGLNKEITEKEGKLLTNINSFNEAIDKIGVPKPFRISKESFFFPEHFYGIKIDRHWRTIEEYVKSFFNKDVIRLFHIMYNMMEESKDFKVNDFSINKIKNNLYEITVDTANDEETKRKYYILFSFVENNVYVYRVNIVFEDIIVNDKDNEITTNVPKNNLEICYCKNFFGTEKQILIGENNSCDRLLSFIDSRVYEVKKFFNEKIDHI